MVSAETIASIFIKVLKLVSPNRSRLSFWPYFSAEVFVELKKKQHYTLTTPHHQKKMSLVIAQQNKINKLFASTIESIKTEQFYLAFTS